MLPQMGPIQALCDLLCLDLSRIIWRYAHTHQEPETVYCCRGRFYLQEDDSATCECKRLVGEHASQMNPAGTELSMAWCLICDELYYIDGRLESPWAQFQNGFKGGAWGANDLWHMEGRMYKGLWEDHPCDP